MKVVTAAIRRELGGKPSNETKPVTPIDNLHMYKERIVAAASGVPAPTCMSQYPLAQIRSEIVF